MKGKIKQNKPLWIENKDSNLVDTPKKLFVYKPGMCKMKGKIQKWSFPEVYRKKRGLGLVGGYYSSECLDFAHPLVPSGGGILRLYPNKTQREQLTRAFGIYRFVYNKVLDAYRDPRSLKISLRRRSQREL